MVVRVYRGDECASTSTGWPLGENLADGVIDGLGEGFEDEGVVVILSTKADVEVLAMMLANEVIGEGGHNDQGLIESLNEGYAPDDPYWGSDHTMEDAANLAADLLEGLTGGKPFGSHDAVTAMREAIIMATPDEELEG